MEQALTKREFVGMDIVVWALSHITKHRSKEIGIEYRITSIAFDDTSEARSDDGVLEQPCLYELVMSKVIGIGMRIAKKDSVECTIKC